MKIRSDEPWCARVWEVAFKSAVWEGVTVRSVDVCCIGDPVAEGCRERILNNTISYGQSASCGCKVASKVGLLRQHDRCTGGKEPTTFSRSVIAQQGGVCEMENGFCRSIEASSAICSV